jgi:hypothetical protein
MIENELARLSESRSLVVFLGPSYLANITQPLYLSFLLWIIAYGGDVDGQVVAFDVFVDYAPLPTVTFSDNLIQTNTDPSLRWSISASGAIVNCDGSASSSSSIRFSYAWSQTYGPPIELFSDNQNSLVARRLAFTPYSMLPETEYRFLLNVSTLAPAASVSLTAVIVVSTLVMEPVAVIDGGQTVRMSSFFALELDGSRSYDPNYRFDNPMQSMLQFEWSCHRFMGRAGRSRCFTGRSALQMEAAAQLQSTQSRISFNASTLVATLFNGKDSPYFFELKVTSNSSGLSSKFKQAISVVGAAIPTVSIASSVGTSIPSTRPVMAVGTAVNVRKQVIDISSGEFLCLWRCVVGGFDMSSDNTDLISDPASMNLWIAPQALVPGRRYTFSLNVWPADMGDELPEAPGTALFSFRVAAPPPSGGNCSCSPSFGDVSTTFTLRCFDWLAGMDLGEDSLYFSFAAVLSFNGVSMPLGDGLSASPSLDARLPVSGDSLFTEVIATICDPLNSCSTFTFRAASVIPIPLQATDAINEIAANLQTGDMSSLLTAAATFSSADGEANDKMAVSNALLNAVMDIGGSGSIDPNDQEGSIVQQSSMAQAMLIVIGSPGAQVEAAAMVSAQNFFANRTSEMASMLRQQGQNPLAISYETAELAGQLAVSTLSLFSSSVGSLSNSSDNSVESAGHRSASSAAVLSSVSSLATMMLVGQLPSPLTSSIETDSLQLYSQFITPSSLSSNQISSSTNTTVSFGSATPSDSTTNLMVTMLQSDDIFSRNITTNSGGSKVISITLHDSSGHALDVTASDESNPMVLVIPVIFPDLPSNWTVTPVCRYFDETTQTWESSGVTVDNSTNSSGQIRCNALHFTSFAVQFDTSPPKVNLLTAEDFLNLSWENLMKHPVPFFSVTTVCGLFFLLMMCLAPYDTKNRLQFGDVLLSSADINGLPPIIWETWIQPRFSKPGATISREDGYYRIRFLGRNDARESLKHAFEIEIEKSGKKPTKEDKLIIKKLNASQEEREVILQLFFLSDVEAVDDAELEYLHSLFSLIIGCETSRFKVSLLFIFIIYLFVYFSFIFV